MLQLLPRQSIFFMTDLLVPLLLDGLVVARDLPEHRQARFEGWRSGAFHLHLLEKVTEMT